MDYFDILLAKKLNGGGGGDITVESLSVTENGTYTAPSGKAYTPVTVEVEPPEDSYQLKSITTPTSLATFEASAMPMPSLKVSVEAKQDLHGYDKPWPAGGGKNKLPMTVDGIKSANTDGTWSGDSYTLNGTTFTIMTDGQNVVGIKVNNKPSKNTEFYIINDASNSCPFNGYILNGCINGSNSTYDIRVSDVDTTSTMQTTGTGEVIDVTSTGKWKCTIMIRATYTPNNLMFYPMIRLATETDATFAPYSNECPISGWDAANISDVGKNLFDNSHFKFVKDGYIGNNSNWVGGTTILDYPNDSLSNYWNSPLIDVSKLRNKTIAYSNFVSVNGVYRGLVDKNFNVLMTTSNSSTPNGIIDLTQYPTAKYLVLSFAKSSYSLDNAQVEIGSTATTYEPYNGVTTTISLGQTVYGAEVDVVNGGGKITHGYIASYNGETLPSTWISSMDVYAEGTTPTTGAEVCYELATPTTVSITPSLIKSLNGQNNLSVDCGEILEGEYFKALGGA